MTSIYTWGAIAVTALAAAGVMYWQTNRIADLRFELDKCRAATTTLERINDAISSDRTADDILERLRSLAE
jgi:hypothetical protein